MFVDGNICIKTWDGGELKIQQVVCGSIALVYGWSQFLSFKSHSGWKSKSFSAVKYLIRPLVCSGSILNNIFILVCAQIVFVKILLEGIDLCIHQSAVQKDFSQISLFFQEFTVNCQKKQVRCRIDLAPTIKF